MERSVPEQNRRQVVYSTQPRLRRHCVHPLLAGLVTTFVLSVQAAADIPVPANCQADLAGANDLPGQRDTTRFCADQSLNRTGWLTTLVDIDDIHLSGADTIDVCSLYDTDGDAFANASVCITLRSTGSQAGNLTQLKEIRLFSCEDTAADRCRNHVLLAGPYNSTCEVSHTEDDPFGPATPNGPGDDYPWDTRILCDLDPADFATAAAPRQLLDGCSYPSALPASSPADCVIFATCVGAADCNDGNACTADRCDPSGVCAHSPTDGAPCDDGLFCNGGDQCNAFGFCRPDGVPLSCDDGWSCTVDSCDEFTDQCVNDPRSSLCDDGLACNGVETCEPPVAGFRTRNRDADPDAGCMAGFAPDCDDGIACTLDTCDESGGGCAHTPYDGACDDGSMCNGGETCDPTVGCRAGAPPDCSDGVSCTIDACDERTRSCVHQPDLMACSDGQFCNGVEGCDATLGCLSGVPPDCDDRVTCTIDACDEGTDRCDHTPDHGACSNGQFCDGVETCDPASGCTSGPEPCAGPAVCREESDACFGCGSDADCDNGVFCDGPESCDSTTGTCRNGAAPDCNDGVGCTVDSCDEVANRCDHSAASALCDNGLFCDGRETCDIVGGCRPGIAPNCEDGVDCTDDTCSESTDSCRHSADDSQCDDGSFCDGNETCDAARGCQDGTPVVCAGDNLACSAERCDERSRSCTSDLTRCICGDGEVAFPEECDPPNRAGTFEDCNNSVDDDRDGLVDCLDPECQSGVSRGRVCDENCRIDRACLRIGKDPASIVYNFRKGPSSLWVHGRITLQGSPDPMVDGIEIRISNAVQPIYSAALTAGDLKGNASGRRFDFTDRAAADLGQASSRGGLTRVILAFQTRGGVRYLTFRIHAYGDFSAATRPLMTTQITVGSEVASLTKEWSAAPKRWYLRDHEF